MAIIAQWSGAGLADGTAVTTSTAGTGDDAFDAVTASTFTVDASGLHPPRIQVDQQGGSDAQLTWLATIGATLTDWAVRLYVELTAYPGSGAWRLIDARDDTNALLWWVDVHNSGTVRLKDAAGITVDQTAAAVGTGAELRVEAVADADDVTVYVYAGNGTTPVDTLTAAGLGVGLEQLRFGDPGTSPTLATAWFDEIALSDTAALIGPVPSVIPSGTGTMTATSSMTGSGQKIGVGTGTMTATSTLTGSGENATPSFPFVDLATHLELRVGGAWVEVTPSALVADPITITRGRANEAGRAAPASLTATIRDPSGQWAPRNPASPLYGLIGRNTPVRVRIGDGPRYAYLPGIPGNYLSTPDAPAIALADGVDVRVDITPDTWRPEGIESVTLASKYDYDGDRLSWIMGLTRLGTIRLRVSQTGAFADSFVAFSTEAIPLDSARLAVRALFNGADPSSGGLRTYTFFTGPTVDGPWTQLGDVVVGSGTSTLHLSSVPLEIGSAAGGESGFADARPFHGQVHGFQLRDLAGTVVADPDIIFADEGVTSWTGAAGLTWTAGGYARILRPSRYHGEVASWPQRWHVSGHNLTVPIQAGGVRRRLSQGAAPVLSTLRREMTATAPPSLVQYWPMEDAGGAFASAFPSGAPLRLVTGEPNFAADDTFVGSGPLATWDEARATGTVPGYTVTGETQVRMLLKMPDTPPDSARRMVMVATTGTAARWDVWYSTTSGGRLGLSIYDREGNALLEHVTGRPVAGIAQRVSLELRQNGADIDWQLVTLEQGAESGFAPGGTLTGHTVGQVRSVVVGDVRGLDNTVIGHLSVYSEITSIFDLVDQFNAFTGEPAGARITRLGHENDTPVTVIGDILDTTAMGPQRIATLDELWQDAADADGGILHDARDDLGVEYRTRVSLYNQTPAVTLDYPTPGEVPPPLTPTEDDQGTRNDVTVEREGGSSARFVLEDGPLSVLQPPAGVGRYDESVRLNVHQDEQLLDIAAWRVRVGTVDEPRYPKVGMWLHTAPGKIDAATSVDVGDRVQITNPPAWLPPGVIDQIVQGYKETLLPRQWRFELNAGPASPYTVAIVDDDDLGRVDTDGAELVEDVDETATGLLVASTAGPRWTTDPAEVPFGVTLGGEGVEVTAVADGIDDGFDRTVSAGWGSAPDGRAWSVFATAADYSVGSSVGRMSIPAVFTERRAALAGLDSPAADVETTLRTLAVPTGDALFVYVLTHVSADLGTFYSLRVRMTTTGTIGLALETGPPDFAVLAPERIIPGLVPTAGAWLRARVRVQGGQLAGKLWADGAPEPREWQVTARDTRYSSGGFGVRSYLPPGSTLPLPVAFEWGEFVVHNPQTFTVARSANGIVKSHQAGADVGLTQPAYLAL